MMETMSARSLPGEKRQYCWLARSKITTGKTKPVALTTQRNAEVYEANAMNKFLSLIALTYCNYKVLGLNCSIGPSFMLANRSSI